VREKLAFSEEEVASLLPQLRARLKADEALLLSTCNRTEVLLASRTAEYVPAEGVLATLCDLRARQFATAESVTYEHHDEDAVRHVLRVASGLDSMVLGEPQILGQLRRAYALSSEAEATGLYLNKILHTAFRCGKRVRTETELGYGAVSVAYVAVALARKVFGRFNNRTALVIGAGEMARAAALHLKEQEIGTLLFLNRTFEKAQELALANDGEALGFDALFSALERADIVISSTGSPQYIVTDEMFHRVMEKRHTRSIFLIDLAVPRDMDPDINEHTNAFLYDIDNLQQVAERNLGRRRQAIPAAEAIMEEEMGNWRRWRENLSVEPIVKLLHERFDEVRRCEVRKNQKHFCDKEAKDLEKLTLLIQKKLLHRPAEILRQCDPETEEGQRTLEVIRHLFDLK
jgi:glutamyl-tRNA reductase